MQRAKFFFSLVKESFTAFMEDNALKLSATLSYYTVFSLAPMLLVIISMVSIFLGKEVFQGELFSRIAGFVGKQAAMQLQEIIRNAEISNKSVTAATVGVVTLFFGSFSYHFLGIKRSFGRCHHHSLVYDYFQGVARRAFTMEGMFCWGCVHRGFIFNREICHQFLSWQI